MRKTITGYRSEGFASELTRAAQVLKTAGIAIEQAGEGSLPDTAARGDPFACAAGGGY